MCVHSGGMPGKHRGDVNDGRAEAEFPHNLRFPQGQHQEFKRRIQGIYGKGDGGSGNGICVHRRQQVQSLELQRPELYNHEAGGRDQMAGRPHVRIPTPDGGNRLGGRESRDIDKKGTGGKARGSRETHLHWKFYRMSEGECEKLNEI